MLAETTRNGCATVAVMPVKHFVMQVAINTHLLQSTGAFDGQHGMSLAISPVMADGDISSAIASIETSGARAAMTGRETGANTRPAIIKTASSRCMAIWQFIPSKSHEMARIDSLARLTTP